MERPKLGEENPIQTLLDPNTRAGSSARTGTLPAGTPPQLLHRKKKAAGPQLWAVVFTIGGLYYFWTKILGRSVNLPRRSHRVGSSKGHGTINDIQAARERRLATLESANRTQAKDTSSNIRERTNNVNSGNGSMTTLEERQRLNQMNMQQRQKRQELEEKKNKQRQLYLRQKALKEKENEERRKDEELGPGWRAREDPSSVANLLDQQGSTGGYKAQSCTRRGG